MLEHPLVALVLTAITVIIHGAGTLLIARVIRGRGQKWLIAPKPFQAVLAVFCLISFLLVLHLAEAGVWAACYWLAGMLPDFETAAYFSFTSYTTVGYGDVLLPPERRTLGPIEAGVGILMFGWSTAIMVRALEPVFGARPESATKP